MQTRRGILLGGGAAAALAMVGGATLWRGRGEAGVAGSTGGEAFEVTLTEAQWRERLTPAQFAVLREEATEPAFSSPLNAVEEPGTFLCAGCANPVFATETKFESGTGWPSFTEPLPGGIGTRTDYKLIYPRTEVHCARCGGHLGHVFEDGPEPTGLRYCMNGVAMEFRPADA